jgi:hypothetical protein
MDDAKRAPLAPDKKVTIRLDPDVYKALRVQCIQNELTVQAALGRLVENWLAEQAEAASDPPGTRLEDETTAKAA